MIKLVHKRALCLLLSVVLVLTMLPETALALALKNGVSYLDSNGGQSSANHVEMMDNSFTGLSDGWYMVDSGEVTINQTLTVSGNAKLILADGANLTVNGTAGNNAGIYVTQGNSLTIYSQSVGSNMGKLTSTGRGGGAGIGSASNGNSPGGLSSGTISICGGRITATGGCCDGSLGPGIGNVDGPSFGTISIYGGMVTATNGDGSNRPDIGSIQGGGDKILITGGTIVSNRSGSRVNLGVNVTSTTTLPTIVIDGGSFQPGAMRTPALGSSPFINSEGNSVPLNANELTIPGQANAAVSSISIDGQPYGNSVYTDGSGTLYLHVHAAYNSTVPVVATMKDGSKYWAGYQPTDFSQAITLVNAAETSVFPGTAVFVAYEPQDIKAYKWDSGNTFTGIRNGTTTLKQDQDYTVVDNAVTIKKEYLATLPVGVTSLTFSGLLFADSTLKILVIPYPEYLALGDSIASGYGLSGYNPNSQTPPATAYPSIVGGTLRLALKDDAFDGMNSEILLDQLENLNIETYSKVKTVTLSIGSNDILLPFLNIVAHKLHCSPEDVSLTLADMFKHNPQALSTPLGALDADDGSGLKNNQALNEATSGFSQNFQDIISALKIAMPNAKIYVTNVYNPYEGIKLPYGAGILDLGGIADGYIRTLNRAFSPNSADYTLIDNYSLFSNSLKTGICLVNADYKSSNLDPHPNTRGHAAIAATILTAGGYTLTTGTVSTAIGSLSEHSNPAEVASALAQALGLSAAAQSALAPQQVAKLEGMMQGTLSVVAPTISTPDTTGFSGFAALPGAPTATGLMLATYGASGATLSTIQASPPSGITGGLIAFDLTLREGGASQPTHSKLLFPVTVTIPLPPNFVPKSGVQYHINHTLPDLSIEPIPVTISETSGHYIATFRTTSFSMFTLVETPDGSSSSSHHSSSVSVPNPSVTGSTAATTFVSDTNADFSVNGAYQFRITSQNGTAPSLTVGTPGVFETQLIRASDGNYYFKLTAIGKPGEKAGIYVNGVKLLAATVGTAVSLVKSDTSGSFKVAKSKNYMFKLKADRKPSFVSGSSSVFLVKFIKQSGRDYYYQVTATGHSGRSAGFYINADKIPIAVATVA